MFKAKKTFEEKGTRVEEGGGGGQRVKDMTADQKRMGMESIKI